jgi:hypothetical protein
MRPIVPAVMATVAAVLLCHPAASLGWWDKGHQILRWVVGLAEGD